LFTAVTSSDADGGLGNIAPDASLIISRTGPRAGANLATLVARSVTCLTPGLSFTPALSKTPEIPFLACTVGALRVPIDPIGPFGVYPGN